MVSCASTIRRTAENRHRARTTLLTFVLLASVGAVAHGQTIEDGELMPARSLCTGFVFMSDGWDRYWEGTLRRENGNIGTVTTRSVTWGGIYGVTNRLNVIAMLPYVWTDASAGTLRGMSGFQDLTVAAKLQLLETDFTRQGSLRAIAVGVFATPTHNYEVDDLPLSIGSGSRRFSGRLTLRFQAKRGWYIDGSAAYTWRGNVQLDRVAYFTDNQLILSDQVRMPDVFDFTVTAGYSRGSLHLPISFSQQYTLGGSDIRREDMPFVSDRMNSSRIDAMLLRSLPKLKDVTIKLAATYTVSGRNVGQATTFTAGALYTFRF